MSNGKAILVLALILLGLYVLTSHGGGSESTGGPNEGYRQYAAEQATLAGIPADLFVKQIQVESGFDPNARGAAGEIGLCQYLPKTAEGLHINPYDPYDCMRGMASHMARYYSMYGSYEKALAGYNAGGNAIARANAYGPAWGCHIPGTTQHYIYLITGEVVCS